MRIFNVKVNGKQYNVEIEETNGSAPVAISAPVAAVAPVATPAPTPAPVAAAPAPATPVASGNGTPIKAPMPGTINSIKAANGSSVNAGDTIIVIEAMKMEVPIKTSTAGVVSIVVSQGASVNSGDILAYIG